MTHQPVWAGRMTPWLRLGPAPGSFRIKAPPRVARRDRGPQVWAPYVTIAQFLHQPSARPRFSPHHI
jgi:hypothetical protein